MEKYNEVVISESLVCDSLKSHYGFYCKCMHSLVRLVVYNARGMRHPGVNCYVDLSKHILSLQKGIFVISKKNLK